MDKELRKTQQQKLDEAKQLLFGDNVPKKKSISNTLGTITRDVFGVDQVTEDELNAMPLGASIAVGAARDLVGSKGLLANFQNIGQQLAADLPSQRKTFNDTLGSSINQQTEILNRIAKETDPVKKKKLQDILKTSTNDISTVANAQQQLSGPSNAEIAADSASSFLAAAQLGIGANVASGASGVGKAILQEVALGGAQTASTEIADKLDKQQNVADALGNLDLGEIALGGAISGVIPLGSALARPVLKPVLSKFKTAFPTAKELINDSLVSTEKRLNGRLDELASITDTKQVDDILKEEYSDVFKKAKLDENEINALTSDASELISRARGVGDIADVINVLSNSLRGADANLLADGLTNAARNIDIADERDFITRLETRKAELQNQLNSFDGNVQALATKKKLIESLNLELQQLTPNTPEYISLSKQISKEVKAFTNQKAGTGNVSDDVINSVVSINDSIEQLDLGIEESNRIINDLSTTPDVAQEANIDNIVTRSGDKKVVTQPLVGYNSADQSKIKQLATEKPLRRVDRNNFFSEIKELALKKFVDEVEPMIRFARRYGVEFNDSNNFGIAHHLWKSQVSAMNEVDSVVFKGFNDRLRGIADAVGVNELKFEKDFGEYMTAIHSLDFSNANGVDNIFTKTKADNIISDFTKKYGIKLNQLEALRKDIVEFNQNKLRVLSDNKLIDSDFAKELIAKYPNYVPTWREIDGKVVDVVFQSQNLPDIIKTLEGSKLDILNPYSSSLYKGQQINKVIKQNEVRGKLFNFIRDSKDGGDPMFDLFDIKEVKRTKSELDTDRIIFTDTKTGKNYEISSNKRELIEPFKFMGGADTAVSSVASKMSYVQNYMSFLLTRGNPAFKLVSIPRDYIESLMAYSSLGGRKVIAPWDVTTGMKAFIDMERGVVNSNSTLAKRAKELGVFQTTYSSQYDDIGKEFSDSLLKKDTKTKRFFSNMDKYIDSAERGNRFAVFKKALDEGFSEQQAAELAKESLINFDKGGQLTKHFRPWFLFFNAIQQGTRGILRSMTDPRTAAATLSATLGAIYLTDEFNSSIEPDWKNYVDSFERSSNMVIVTGRDVDENGKVTLDTFKIPIPIGLRPLWKAEDDGVEYAKGNKDLGEVVSNFGVSMLNMLSPTGNEFIDSAGENQSALNLIAPSIAKPLVNVFNNKNFFGSEIVPLKEGEDGYMEPAALSETYGDDLSEEVAMKVSEFVRKITGDESRWSDPRSIEEIVKGYLVMGTVRDAEKANNILQKISDGEEISNRDIPGWNKFFGSTNTGTQFVRDRERFLKNMKQADTPEAKERVIFEDALANTTTDFLSWGQRKLAIDNGIEDIPEVSLGNFSLNSQNAKFAKFLIVDVNESNNQILKEQKQNYLKSLQINKPDEYKKFIEWEIAYKYPSATPNQIKEYYKDEYGIEVKRVNKDYFINKHYAIKREIEGRQAQYNVVSDVKNEIKDSVKNYNEEDFISPARIKDVYDNLSELQAKQLISDEEVKDITKDLYDNYSENLFTYYKNKLLSGNITVEEMVNSVKARNVPEAIKMTAEFLENNNY